MKKYYQFMQEISPKLLEKGLLGSGMFADKIPPVFTSKKFYKWCKMQPDNMFSDKENRSGLQYYGKDYVRYENMRNINIPRPLAIPHPIAYRNQVKALSESWSQIQKYFKKKTKMQSHKISRIHIRKLKSANHLFEMNYKNFSQDDIDVEVGLSTTAAYLVKADISNCFPSIYTHSIPWALVGKKIAKNSRGNNWYNNIDKFSRNTKHGETHGILIGPHASNLISEIVLSAVDKKLYAKGYRYIRNVDDYSCYIESNEKAEQFLLDLASELKKYELTLNHKKTEILPLPIGTVEHWVNQMSNFNFKDENKVSYKELKSYVDLAIELSSKYKNTAVINYAIKVLSKKEMSSYVKKHYLKRINHLILIYPYLIPLIEKYIFKPLGVSKRDICSFSNDILKIGLERNLWEAVSYALYFAIEYDFDLDISCKLFNKAKQSNDNVFLILAYLYEKKHGCNVGKYIDLAKKLQHNDFDRNWIFVYELLNSDDMKDIKVFEQMKYDGISFIRKKFR